MVDQALLTAAQDAIRRGDRREARALLSSALKENSRDYRIWLLMAGAASSPRASLDYVERAERLQPGNTTVARARSWAEARLAAAAGSPTEMAPGRLPAVTPPVGRTRPAPAAASSTRSRRPMLRIAFAGLLLILVVLAAGWVRGQRSPAIKSGDAISERVDGSAPAEATTDARDAVVRGQFLPHRDVADTATPVPTGTSFAFAAHRKLSQSSGTPRATWTVTPSPTPTPTATPTIAPTFVSESTAPQLVLRPASVGPNERWIDVNLTQQRLVAYDGDTPVFETLVSSGTWNHPTVTGEFRVWLRFSSQTMDGSRLGYNYYLENVPYVMYFFEDYALHGTFWHNNFGTPMSHGCVNLPTPAAEWIFNWSSIGTLVSVHY